MSKIETTESQEQIFEESGFSFSFSFCEAIKFDECRFYRKNATDLKAVDFMALKSSSDKISNDQFLYLVEVKNFTDHESDEHNKERLSKDGNDRIDLEIVSKVKDSLFTLLGASTFSNKDSALDISKYYSFLTKKKTSDSPNIVVVAFLEGNLSHYSDKYGRKRKDILSIISKLIKKKLALLNCEVLVVNSDSISLYQSIMPFYVKKSYP